MNNARKELRTAIAKSLFGKYALYLVQIIQLSIFARLFTPEEFGIFASIQVFAIFFLMIGDMGLGPAIIFYETLTKKERNGIFSFTWLIGCVLAVLFFLFSFILNSYYENHIYPLLAFPISLSILFSSGSLILSASFQKDKLFLVAAWLECISEFFATVFVLLIYLLGGSFLVLAYKNLFFSIARFSLWFYASNQTSIGRPSMGKYFIAVKPLLRFSINQFVFNAVNYFSRNLDNILVAKYFSTATLGIYEKAYQIMRYPLLLLTYALAPAIHPVLTKFKSNLIYLEQTHSELIKRLALLGAYAGFAIYFSADMLVSILLGSQWSEVSSLLKILSVSIPLQVVMGSSGGFFQATGETKLMLFCGIFAAITNISAIIVGISLNNLKVLCWALVISFTINFMQCYAVMYIVLFKRSIFYLIKALFPAILLFGLSIPAILIGEHLFLEKYIFTLYSLVVSSLFFTFIVWKVIGIKNFVNIGE